MKTTRSLWPLILLVFPVLPVPVLADAPSFNVTAVTPVGSWAEREERKVDHKNRETVTVLRQTMVDKEDRDGETCYWVESETTSYKINKKGNRKQQGDPAIVKVLIAESALNGDPANLASNLTGFGKEIILQTGDAQPMRIREGGALGGMMMQALGIQIDFQFTKLGDEKVETPAGEFKAEKFSGTGSAEGRVLFQKISVQSESEIWMTPAVPFGFASSVSKEMVNGKPSSSQAQVTSFGMEGGVSKITGEPMDFMGGQDGGMNLKDLMPGSGG